MNLLKMSTRDAMKMLMVTTILTYLAAVMMVNDFAVAVVITVSVVSALMVGWTYIQAVKSVVTAAIEAGKVNLDEPL